jgi:transcriptional regulator with XRE-family HTH domain
MERKMEVFALKLKALRIASGLSQKELALKAGLSLSGIADMEQGKRDPYWTTVITLAKALEVTPNDFLTAPTEEVTQGRGRPPKKVTD